MRKSFVTEWRFDNYTEIEDLVRFIFDCAIFNYDCDCKYYFNFYDDEGNSVDQSVVELNMEDFSPYSDQSVLAFTESLCFDYRDNLNRYKNLCWAEEEEFDTLVFMNYCLTSVKQFLDNGNQIVVESEHA